MRELLEFTDRCIPKETKQNWFVSFIEVFAAGLLFLVFVFTFKK